MHIFIRVVIKTVLLWKWLVIKRVLEVGYFTFVCLYHTFKSLIFRFERAVLSDQSRAALARLRQQESEIRHLRDGANDV